MGGKHAWVLKDQLGWPSVSQMSGGCVAGEIAEVHPTAHPEICLSALLAPRRPWKANFMELQTGFVLF